LENFAFHPAALPFDSLPIFQNTYNSFGMLVENKYNLGIKKKLWAFFKNQTMKFHLD
jgi:hypothetical protein